MSMTSSASAANPGVQRRVFMLIQAAKALVGGALGLSFFGMVGRPDRLELIAMAGLLMPGALALLGFTKIRLSVLEQIGLAGFALLIGYLAFLTGGVTSPLVVWFALVPAEAALVGGRPAVMRAGIAAAVALLAVAAIEALGLLPASRLILPVWEI
jgi:cell cycle sensor histidine kinase DivJ